MYPLKLKPIYDKTIWANDKLTKIRGVNAHEYGTSWEISAHPYCQNEIVNGPYAGATLETIIEKSKDDMLGSIDDVKMLRLAFLDAKEHLSIQVHPYTAYAAVNDKDYGKTESWYVLDADPNAKLVAGTKTTDKSVLREAIKNETLEEHLQYHPIVAGDFIHIPAGMLHALGAGILAIEVGTNSNTTYRFYDYGRKDHSGKGRELHLEKSFDVVDVHLQSEVIHTPLNEKHTTPKILTKNTDYVVELIDVDGEYIVYSEDAFNCLCFVHNGAKIVYENTILDVAYCDSVFVPASCKSYKIVGQCRVLRSYVGK